MNIPYRLMTTLCCLAAVLLAGCGSGAPRYEATNQSTTAGKTAAADQEAPQEKVVLLARLDPGPLAASDPESATRIPRDLVKYLHMTVDFARASFSEVLPSSGDPAWSDGPVGALSGANVGITIRVDELVEETTPAPPGSRIAATVTMAAYSVRGVKLWEQTTIGEAPNEVLPKFRGPSAQPQTRAVFAACREAVLSLGSYLGTFTADDPRINASQKELGDLPLIDIQFDSTPPNADVYIDGIFRGTTPVRIGVPDKTVEVQIKRQGYQPWATTLRPEVGMPIKPALEAEL